MGNFDAHKTRGVRVYSSIQEFEGARNPVVTTGTFDGVHVGHRRIIAQMRQLAAAVGGETVLLTFDPHPRMALHPGDHGLKLLSTVEERTDLLREAGIDHLIIHPFTREFSRTTSIDFIRGILVETIGTHRLVIGYDHHFGRNREGSFEHLKESGPIYGFEVEEIPAQEVDDVKVSSTKIRKALEDGDVSTANDYLGAPYRITGTVVPGNKLGRKLGFPTANVRVEEEHKLIPANGVYAVHVRVGENIFRGMLNIGHRPTVSNGMQQRTIEAHLFDFSSDLYDRSVVITLERRIRDEQRFDGIDELRAQLERDRDTILAMP